MALMPVEDALARLLAAVPEPKSEPVSIYEARGRVLADDLAARLTQPPFDASAMDGYAIRSADSRDGARLRLVGHSRAGESFAGGVSETTAVRILTGAPVPDGADTVVIQENVRLEDDAIVIVEAPAKGANIRRRGIDFKDGEIGLHRGVRLDAHRTALAAAMGHGTVPVYRRPRVAILATGDELVEPGTTPGPDQIVSSNPAGLKAMIEDEGAIAILLGIARDDRGDLTARIERARADADVLVTIGGASVGDHDLVGPVLRDLGMDFAFWKIAMRPGKPLMFGRLGETLVLGLPGNPVSALIAARVFLVPLIAKATGRTHDARRERARLLAPLEENGPRLHYMRAKLSTAPDGTLAVTPLASQDSSLLAALSTANCLILRAPGAAAADVGADVDVERL